MPRNSLSKALNFFDQKDSFRTLPVRYCTVLASLSLINCHTARPNATCRYENMPSRHFKIVCDIMAFLNMHGGHLQHFRMPDFWTVP